MVSLRQHLFPKLGLSTSEWNAAKSALVCAVTACPPLMSSLVRRTVPVWLPSLFAFVAFAGCRTVGTTIRFVQVFGVWVAVGFVVRTVLATLISHEIAELAATLGMVAFAGFAPDEDASDFTKLHAFRIGLLSMEALVQGCRDGLPDYEFLLTLTGSRSCMEATPVAALGAVTTLSLAVWPLVHLPVAALLCPHLSSVDCVSNLKAALEELAGVLEGWGRGTLRLTAEQQEAVHARLQRAKSCLRSARAGMAGFELEVSWFLWPGRRRRRAHLHVTRYSLDLGYGLSDQLLLLADYGSGVDHMSLQAAELAQSLAMEIMPSTAGALRLLCGELVKEGLCAEEVCRAKDRLAAAATELTNLLEEWRSAYIGSWRNILGAAELTRRAPIDSAIDGTGQPIEQGTAGGMDEYLLDRGSLSERYSAMYAFLFMATSLQTYILEEHARQWAAEGWSDQTSHGSLGCVGIYALEKRRTMRRVKNAVRATATFAVLAALVHIPEMPASSMTSMLITASSMMSQGYGTLGGVVYRGVVRSFGLLAGTAMSLGALYLLAGNTAAMLLSWFIVAFALTRLYDGAAHPYSVRYAGQVFSTSALPAVPMTAPPPPDVMLAVVEGTGFTLAGAAATFAVNLLVFPHRSHDMAIIKTAAALKHAGYQIQAMVCSVATGMPVSQLKVEEMVTDLTERVRTLKALLAVAGKERPLLGHSSTGLSLEDLARCLKLLEALVPDLRMLMRAIGTGFHNPSGRVYSLYLLHLAPQLQEAGTQIAYSLQGLSDLVQAGRGGGVTMEGHCMLPDLGPLAATYQDVRVAVREAAVTQGWLAEDDFVEAVMDSENLLISMNAFVVTLFHCVKLISQASVQLLASEPSTATIVVN